MSWSFKQCFGKVVGLDQQATALFLNHFGLIYDEMIQQFPLFKSDSLGTAKPGERNALRNYTKFLE
jgi:hypothetical protein